jgi:hypothetical protein
MKKQWMIATSYCSVCNRPWKSSLSYTSVLSAIAGLLESDTSSSGWQIHEKDSQVFIAFSLKFPNNICFINTVIG